MLRKTLVIGLVGLVALTAACGDTVEESAATGGLGGAAVGAVVGGPVGAAVGLGVGAAGGTGVEYAQEHPEALPAAQGQQAQAPGEDVRQAQMALRQRGLYEGPIDGIAGPRTREGVARFQQHEGLPQTSELDPRTRDLLSAQTAEVPQRR